MSGSESSSNLKKFFIGNSTELLQKDLTESSKKPLGEITKIDSSNHKSVLRNMKDILIYLRSRIHSAKGKDILSLVVSSISDNRIITALELALSSIQIADADEPGVNGTMGFTEEINDNQNKKLIETLLKSQIMCWHNLLQTVYKNFFFFRIQSPELKLEGETPVFKIELQQGDNISNIVSEHEKLVSSLIQNVDIYATRDFDKSTLVSLRSICESSKESCMKAFKSIRLRISTSNELKDTTKENIKETIKQYEENTFMESVNYDEQFNRALNSNISSHDTIESKQNTSTTFDVDTLINQIMDDSSTSINIENSATITKLTLEYKESISQMLKKKTISSDDWKEIIALSENVKMTNGNKESTTAVIPDSTIKKIFSGKITETFLNTDEFTGLTLCQKFITSYFSDNKTSVNLRPVLSELKNIFTLIQNRVFDIAHPLITSLFGTKLANKYAELIELNPTASKQEILTKMNKEYSTEYTLAIETFGIDYKLGKMSECFLKNTKSNKKLIVKPLDDTMIALYAKKEEVIKRILRSKYGITKEEALLTNDKYVDDDDISNESFICLLQIEKFFEKLAFEASPYRPQLELLRKEIQNLKEVTTGKGAEMYKRVIYGTYKGSQSGTVYNRAAYLLNWKKLIETARLHKLQENQSNKPLNAYKLYMKVKQHHWSIKPFKNIEKYQRKTRKD